MDKMNEAKLATVHDILDLIMGNHDGDLEIISEYNLGEDGPIDVIHTITQYRNESEESWQSDWKNDCRPGEVPWL